jgi:hypothetical protein
MWQSFVTDTPAKRAPTMSPLSSDHVSSFKIRRLYHSPILSQGLSFKRITNELTPALQSVNKRKNIKLKFFQCSTYKQILFPNFLVLPFFCPPLVCIKATAKSLCLCNMPYRSMANGRTAPHIITFGTRCRWVQLHALGTLTPGKSSRGPTG